MESNFWSKLSISKPELPEGILSKNIPLNLTLNDSMKLLTNSDYNASIMKFVLTHSASLISGNSHICDQKLFSHNTNIQIIDKENPSTYYGFILSVPHVVRLKTKDDFESIHTVVTTDLCVHKEHRNKNLASHLILGVIQWGFSNNIYTGYHYIKDSKSASALKIYNYYRPLNIQVCLESGYEIPSFRVKDFILRSSASGESETASYTREQLLKIEPEYKINSQDISKYNITDSEFKDLTYLQNQDRKLSVVIDEERFNFMKSNGFKFKTIKQSFKSKSGTKDIIVGLFIYKNRILYISKSKKSLNTASSVLIEVSQNNTFEIMHSILNYLSEEGYAIMTGSLFGNLSDNTLRKQLSMVKSGYQYLDFYNLHVEHNNDVSKINLLYV
jgi:hypothetical protein